MERWSAFAMISRNRRADDAVIPVLCSLLWDQILGVPNSRGVAHSVLSDMELLKEVLLTASLSKLNGVVASVFLQNGVAVEWLEWANEFKRQVMERNAGVLINLALIDDLLVAHGIRYAVMKGPLQQNILHGDYFHRPVGDLDILVEPDSFARAISVFAKSGMMVVPSHQSIWWDRFLGERHLVRDGATRCVVDVHHRLQQPGSPQPRSSVAFLTRAETHQMRGRRIPVLARRDVPLLCAMSLVKALFNREGAGAHAFDLVVSLGAGRAGAGVVDRFLEDAREQDIEGTALMAIRLVGALFPDFDSSAGRGMLARIPDETLRAMVLAPNTIDAWTQRRHVLWDACLHRPMRMAREFAWLGASEVTRFFEEARAHDFVAALSASKGIK